MRGTLNARVFIYNKMLNSSTCICKSYLKWSETIPISKESWNSYCVVPFNCSNDVSVRWFQYRLLHRIIPTNKYLYTIKVAPSNMCTFCSVFVETIPHLFFQCFFSRRIWVYLQNVFSKIDIQVNFNDELTVLFGCNSDRISNLVIILVKMYTFNCKKQKGHPSVHGALFYLKKNYFAMQKCIFQKNMLLNIWEKYRFPWMDLF